MSRHPLSNGVCEMFHILKRRAACLVALLSVIGAAHADEAFLTVTGNITAGTNHQWSLTRQQFEALPQHNVSTSTSWTKGVHTFTGPLMRDVQRLAGSNSDSMEAFGIDDYVQKYPTSDFQKYDVVLAEKMDGKPLPLDTYGPTWIVYPRDDFPTELKNPMTDGKFAWQVNRLKFK
jgi:hypothetical protein